jgi:hypothetical protein
MAATAQCRRPGTGLAPGLEMTKKTSSHNPARPETDPGADDSTQPATLVAGGPESEGKNRQGRDAPAATPPADAPTPDTHRKGVQPLSGTTD